MDGERERRNPVSHILLFFSPDSVVPLTRRFYKTSPAVHLPPQEFTRQRLYEFFHILKGNTNHQLVMYLFVCVAICSSFDEEL